LAKPPPPGAEAAPAAASQRLLAVVGPTATGKTALGVSLAEQLGAAELLNADSRQVLRGLRVGTNAPSAQDLRGVPCHLLELVDPGRPFSVADWLAAARTCLDELAARAVLPIVVGGTGLYVRALLDGFDLSGDAPDPERRARLNATAATPEGVARLAAELQRRDPQGAAVIDLRNPRRVVRALELVAAHGSVSAGRRRQAQPVKATLIGLDAEPALHRRWIEERARGMLRSGLVAETEAALRRGVPRAGLEASGIGYAEALAILEGRMGEKEAVAEIARRTRRYARAQRTWFRADSRVQWLRRESESDFDSLAARVREIAGSAAP
jgi:tRNA dimethylallyltransferase